MAFEAQFLSEERVGGKAGRSTRDLMIAMQEANRLSMTQGEEKRGASTEEGREGEEKKKKQQEGGWGGVREGSRIPLIFGSHGALAQETHKRQWMRSYGDGSGSGKDGKDGKGVADNRSSLAVPLPLPSP